MSEYSSAISLSKYFQRQIKIWTVISFFGSLGFATAILVWISANEAKSRIADIASTVEQAFRSQILSGDIIGVEAQAKTAFKLQDDEDISILTPDKQPMRTGKYIENALMCESLEEVCTSYLTQRVSTVRPIYFDSANNKLFGYIHITVKDRINWTFMATIITGLFASLLILGLGLVASMSKLFEKLSQKLKHWSLEISKNPKAMTLGQQSNFSELMDVEHALSNLRAEIEKLEKEARTEGKLMVLRGIAHDVMTPVSQLKKMLGVIKAQVNFNGKPTDEAIEKFESYLKKIEIITSQVLVLKENHLENSKLRSEVNLFALIQETIVDLKEDTLIKEKEITLELKGSSNVNTVMSRIDAERILTNLTKNAAHASEKGKAVIIEVRDDQDFTEVIVKDSGSGIEKENLDKIFDVDFSTRPTIGTGLGLPIVKSICEKYKAKINVYSDLQTGTTFKITLPILREVLNEI